MHGVARKIEVGNRGPDSKGVSSSKESRFYSLVSEGEVES